MPGKTTIKKANGTHKKKAAESMIRQEAREFKAVFSLYAAEVRRRAGATEVNEFYMRISRKA